MAPLSVVLRSGCFALLSYTATATVSLPPPPNSNGNDAPVPPLTPSDASIQRNAFSIFNAVHSAMRQWGSSLNHNGMSVFLATVPEGQLLYHGGDESERAKGLTEQGFDWLAFELEHAQMFGRGRGPPPFFTPPGDKPPGKGEGDASPADSKAGPREWDMLDAHYNRRGHHPAALDHERSQKALGSDDDGEDSDDNNDKPKRPKISNLNRTYRGYFHTYRANRPLNLLYIDGMAAGKTDYGCVDSQDMMLLGWPDDREKLWGGEIDRAEELCDMAKKWAWNDKGDHIDGFVRTEAGFEIIYCDFGEGGGLDVVTIQATPFQNETGGLPVFVEAEFLRGISRRYHGFPSGRIHVDWSSMVSAFFYDVNLTNPDASRPELPRLSNVTRNERRGIRARVRDVVAARGHLAVHERQAIDWQGIVDMIVTRFSQRLGQLARGTSAPITTLAGQMLPTLLYAYINQTNPEESHALQLDRCTQQYLLGALAQENSWTPEDRSIYLAIETVTRTICTSLFDIRLVLYNEKANEHVASSEAVAGDDSTVEKKKETQVREIVGDLMGKLQWTTWRECDPCQHPDELCLVAMFPWGDVEDHFHPRCNTMENIQMRNKYWNLERFD